MSQYHGPGTESPDLEAKLAHVAERNEEAKREIQRQQERVAKVKQAKAAMLYSPAGLRGLFPTNDVRLNVTTTQAQLEKARKRMEASK